MVDKYYPLLSQISLFNGIAKDELRNMMGCLGPSLADYDKGEYIAFRGENLECIGILLEGHATVIKETPSGNRTVMTVLEPGDIFGEIIVFSSKTSWPNSVLSIGKSTVLFLDKGKLTTQCNSLCPWHRKIIENMLGIVSDKALMLNSRVEFLTIKNLRGKLSAYFIEQYRKSKSLTFMMGMNRNQLADFFNVSRPSLSRELGKMKNEGIIDFYLETMQILDYDALEREYLENH